MSGANVAVGVLRFCLIFTDDSFWIHHLQKIPIKRSEMVKITAFNLLRQERFYLPQTQDRAQTSSVT